MSNQWANEAEARAEENAQFNEWVDNNLWDLATEYAMEDTLGGEEEIFKRAEWLVVDYEENSDNEFRYWLENKWADADRRIGEE